MKNFIKVLVLGFVFGVFVGLEYFSIDSTLLFSDIIIKYGLSLHYFTYEDIVYITMGLLPYIMFAFVFGTYIYRHYCTASVYFFSRCSNKNLWYIKEMVKLFCFTFFYLTILPLIGLVIASVFGKVTVDKESIIVFVYYLIIYSIWLFSITLLINTLSIIAGGYRAFCIVMGSIAIFLALLSMWDIKGILSTSIDNNPNYNRNLALLPINLIANLVISWHGSDNMAINEHVNVNGYGISFLSSIMFMIILLIIVEIVSFFIINKTDTVTVSKNMEG